jgi:hypothetical protein
METSKTLLERLSAVQMELKAPKSQFNSFGKYNYRNVEDILEAAKPLCAKHDLVLSLDDRLEKVGERYYVRAIAMVEDFLGNAKSVSGYAREEEDKKGMDGSQITGAASSYARKYALNGLFLIDDTKDSDMTNDHSKTPKKDARPTVEHISQDQAAELLAIAKSRGYESKQEAINFLNTQTALTSFMMLPAKDFEAFKYHLEAPGADESLEGRL